MIFLMGSDATQLIDLRRTRTCRHDRLSDCHWLCACSEYSAMDNNQLPGAANDTDQMHLALGSLRATILTLGKYTSYPWARWNKRLVPAESSKSTRKTACSFFASPPEIIQKYLLRSKHNLSHETIQFRDAVAVCERLGPAVHMEGPHRCLKNDLLLETKSVLPPYVLASRGLCNRPPGSWHHFPGLTYNPGWFGFLIIIISSRCWSLSSFYNQGK